MEKNKWKDCLLLDKEMAALWQLQKIWKSHVNSAETNVILFSNTSNFISVVDWTPGIFRKYHHLY